MFGEEEEDRISEQCDRDSRIVSETCVYADGI